MTGKAPGTQYPKGVSVAKRQRANRPGELSARLSAVNRPGELSARLSAVNRPGELSARLSAVNRPGELSARLSAVNRPGELSARLSAVNRPGELSARLSAVNRPGELSARLSAVNRPGELSARLSAVNRPGELSARLSAVNQPGELSTRLPAVIGNYGGTLSNTSTLSTPVTGHKRMVIPTQPPLTATKKSAAKPQPAAAAAPATGIVVTKPQSMPQPVPASYTTASTPTRPTFNVQVKSTQPSPHHMPPGPQGLSPAYNQQYPQQPSRSPGPVQYMPAQPCSPDFAYGPPQPARQPERQPEPMTSHTSPPPRAYYEPQYPGGAGQGAAYGAQNTWRPEPAYPTAVTTGPGYQLPGPRKTYITDPPPAMAPTLMAQYGAPPGMQPKGGSMPPMPPGPVPSHAAAARPEDELERLTKKMLYDMEHPPSEEYFGRCSRCSENVVGEGSGCTAMDQVFHVECFTCVTCSRKLRGQPFYAVEKKAYCEPCYTNTLEQCNVCKTPIMERILRATGKAYHPHCFTCVECHRSLDGIPFTVDAGNHIHCIEDFHKKFAPRCSVCKEPIMPATGQEETVRIVALDRDFHVQCYRCEPGAIEQAIKDIQSVMDEKEDGSVQSAWLLAEVDHWNNEKERIVLLAENSLLICKYDFIMLSCEHIQRIPLNCIDRICHGEFTFPQKSLDKREGEGLRILWDRLQEPTFVSRWNPFSGDFPFCTFTEHPVLEASDRFTKMCALDQFRDQLTQAAQRAHEKNPVPGKANGVLVLKQPILIETYVGLMSFIGNQNKLGCCLFF
ncbi:UNVERIFIED_CONTAM: hypothetical protein FKN15_056712 [Acipenser sinensis]